MDLAYVSDFEAYAVNFNGGKSSYIAINITGGYKTHIEGRCNNCDSGSRMIKNNVTGYTLTGGNGNSTITIRTTIPHNFDPIYDGSESLHIAGSGIGKMSSIPTAPGAAACHFFAVAGTSSGRARFRPCVADRVVQ